MRPCPLASLAALGLGGRGMAAEVEQVRRGVAWRGASPTSCACAGLVNVFARAPVPEWTDGNNRTQITLDEMLHMTSGAPSCQPTSTASLRANTQTCDLGGTRIVTNILRVQA